MEACRVVELLLTRAPWLWDKSLHLNSDGWRLWGRAQGILMEEVPAARGLVRRFRREPSWWRLRRLALSILDEGCVPERPPWLELGPYTTRIPGGEGGDGRRWWPRQGATRLPP